MKRCNTCPACKRVEEVKRQGLRALASADVMGHNPTNPVGEDVRLIWNRTLEENPCSRPMLTFDELAAMYCERQVNTPADLKVTLLELVGRYHPDGFMLLECQMLDSSLCGGYTILPYGPNNTYKAIPEHPISPRGLASDMSTVVATMATSELYK